MLRRKRGGPILAIQLISLSPEARPVSDDRHRNEFEVLALPLLGFLLGLGLRLAGDRSEAEDLVQETLLKAYQAFSRFRPGTNFRAWVGRILFNTFLNEQEKRKRWVADLDPDGFPAPATDPIGSSGPIAPGTARGLSEIPADQFEDEVLRALQELPDGMAVAVYLADVQEFDYEEIAEIMDCPIGTVRSRLARGRRHLQTSLWEHARKRGFLGGES